MLCSCCLWVKLKTKNLAVFCEIITSHKLYFFPSSCVSSCYFSDFGNHCVYFFDCELDCDIYLFRHLQVTGGTSVAGNAHQIRNIWLHLPSFWLVDSLCNVCSAPFWHFSPYWLGMKVLCRSAWCHILSAWHLIHWWLTNISLKPLHVVFLQSQTNYICCDMLFYSVHVFFNKTYFKMNIYLSMYDMNLNGHHRACIIH